MYSINERWLCVFSGSIHWRFALIVWLLIQCQIDDWVNPIPFLIGSIFPDCDHRKAPIGRIFPMWIWCKHRGFTHSLQGVVIFALPIMYFNFKWACIFMAGCLLHIAMDSGTVMGVKWVWRKKVKKRVA